MTEQTQPTDAPLDVIDLMRVVMDADNETRGFALRGTTNWAAHIGKAVQNAVLAKWGTPAGAGEPTEAMIDAGNRARLYREHGDLREEAVLSARTQNTKATWFAMCDAAPQPTNSGSLPEMNEINDLQPTQAQAGAVPLTDEFVNKVVRSKQPHLDTDTPAWKRNFDECKYWLTAAHGIKGADHG